MTAEEITLALGGRWLNGYGNSPCPAHGNRSGALTIKDDPTEPSGLFVKCYAGCNKQAVRDALASLGLIADADGPAPVVDPEVIRKVKEASRQKRAAKIRNAQWLWEYKAIANPSPLTVQRYLLARSIDLDRIGGLPACLRYMPQARQFGSELNFPAMAAAITAPDGEQVAAHLTFLNANCSGKVAIEPDKIIVGSPGGGAAIRLFPMPADGVLGLAEGIESALSAAELFRLPVWASANAELMGVFVPPDGVTRIVIFADHDEVNKMGYRAGKRAAEKLARRLSVAGIPCKVRYPADGQPDFNDELTTRKQKARAA